MDGAATGARAIAVIALASLGIALLVASAAEAAPQPAERDLGSARFGAQIDPVTAPAFCERLRADDSTATTQFLSRGIMETDAGTLNYAGIDSRVNAVTDCGIEIGLRLGTGVGAADPALPADLAHYTDLLTQLATYLKGRVDTFAIENETAAPGHWPGSAESYFQLVDAASAALHAGNPDASVLDGTMASGSMTAVMVGDLYDQGRYEEAIALAQETQANELGGGAPVTDLPSLTAYVSSDKVVRFVHFFDLLVANQSQIDAMQLHYYGPWRGLPDMFDYVRSHGITIPIEAWELNHRYKDGRPFVEQEHADEVARLIITAAGEGSGFTVFSSYLGNSDNDAVGLLDFTGSTDHQARFTFGSVAEELTGATSATRLELPDPAWGYRFERPEGNLVAVWAEPTAATVGDQLGINSTTAAVSTAGVVGVRHVRLDRFDATATPQFVEADQPMLESTGNRSRKAVRLQITCPQASPTANCAGKVKLFKGRGGNRKRVRTAAKSLYRVALSETKRIKVPIARRHGEYPKPTRATAAAKSCKVSGKGGCESWTDLPK